MTSPGPGASGSGSSELRLRVVSALVMAAAVLAAALWGGWPFRLVWIAVAGLAAYEWFAMISGGRGVVGGVVVAAVGLVLGLAPLSDQALAGISAAAALAGAAATPFIRGRLPLEACGVAYALAFALIAPALRAQPGIGLSVVLWSFAVVWFTDIAAYFAGRRFGGPKLMASVSPKKTWSGAIGGVIAGALGGYVVWALSPDAYRIAGPGLAIAGSAAGSIASQAGDLFESALKRRFGAKDSGVLIPGHGGFLDRLDGYWAVLIFAGLLPFIVPSQV